MSILTTAALIIIGILLFNLIVFIHEFGHFITAKMFNTQVNEFAIGMGPKLFSFKKGETTYSLRLFPIGGYCAIEGETEESDNKRAFVNKPVWQRMIIIVAGAFNNIVLGLVMMTILMVQQPVFASTTLSSFAELAFTSKSGLQAGDTIVSVGDYRVDCYRDVTFAIAMLRIQTVDGQDLSIYKEDCGFKLGSQYSTLKAEDYTDEQLMQISDVFRSGIEKLNASTTKEEAAAITQETFDKVNGLSNRDYVYEEHEYMPERRRFRTDVTVIRDGKEITINDVDFFTTLNEEGTPVVQTDFYVAPIEKTFSSTVSQSVKSTVSVVRMVWKSLYGLVTGTYGMNDMAGPVGMASVVTQAAQAGLETGGFLDAVMNIVFVMMIITVNLGIVNLLPLPMLDGGRFLFMLIELIMRKPVPRKYESIVHAIGFLLLIGLILFITFNDIVRLFNGKGLGG